MRARITSMEHEFYNTTFSVSFLNYDMAAGRIENTKKIAAAGFEEVEFTYDASWEESIVNNREILNVKKPKDASYYMYFAILQSIEAHIKGKIKNLAVIDDRETILKKMWSKNIVLVANGSPVEIHLTGKKFSNVFNIQVCDLKKEEFLSSCRDEMEAVREELRKSTKRLNGLMHTIQLMNDDDLNSRDENRIGITGA